MTITTKAGLEAAAKTRICWGISGSLYGSSAAKYSAVGLGSNAQPPDAAMPVPTAFGSGGQLCTNGDAGFPKIPATASQVAEYNVQSNTTSFASQPFSLFDIVWMASGFAGNTAGTQTVSSMPSLTRPDSVGTGLELFLYVRTLTGATSSTCSVSYTNSAGTSGRTATLMLNAGATTDFGTSGAVLPLVLQAGDTGIKSIQSLTFGTSQASAGDVWLFLASRIVSSASNADSSNATVAANDAIRTGMPKVSASAALKNIARLSTGGAISPAIELILAQG